eukprot:3152805-Prymnesium_polylepis.1
MLEEIGKIKLLAVTAPAPTNGEIPLVNRAAVVDVVPFFIGSDASGAAPTQSSTEIGRRKRGVPRALVMRRVSTRCA